MLRIKQFYSGYWDKLGAVHGVLPNGWRIFITDNADRAVVALFSVAYPMYRLVKKRYGTK